MAEQTFIFALADGTQEKVWDGSPRYLELIADGLTPVGSVPASDGLSAKLKAFLQGLVDVSSTTAQAAADAAAASAQDATDAAQAAADAVASIPPGGAVDPDALTKAAWAQAPRVDDLTYPVVIAHRGAANLYPENTIGAYRGAVALGYQAIEAGDVRALADGTLVVMHDGTVDSTTDGTGTVASFTRDQWAALHHDVGQTSWGGTYPLDAPPFWDDALAALAGKCVLMPEVKDQKDSTATAMCDRLDALGARESAIIQSFSMSNVLLAAGRGYKTTYLSSTSAPVLAALSDLKAGGVWSVCIDHSAVTEAEVATMQAAGFRVFLYTIDHRADATSPQALACDGYFTNMGRDYITGNTSAYRKSATSYHLSGRFEDGMVAYGDGPFNGTSRATLIGSPGAWRFRNGTSAGGGVMFGQLCPVANAAGTYTITVKVAVDTIPTSTTQGPTIYFGMPDDSLTHGSDVWSSYLFKIRASGAIQMWSIGATGTAVSLGTATTTKLQNLTTTAGLTAGTAYTSLPVAALTVALKVGHEFMLPTGQVVTVAAAAAVGATSVTVESVTPTAAVASGSVLIPYVTMVATVTPTTVSASRGDEPSVAAITAADTTWRGGYFAAGPQGGYNTGVLSYHKASVA